MARPPEEPPAGAPEWMVTYSDSVTLLVTFFVLMLTFSSMDEEAFRMFADRLVGFGRKGVMTGKTDSDRNALTDRERMVLGRITDEGSDMPGMRKDPLIDPTLARNKQALKLIEIGRARVISVPSHVVFLGNTTCLSRAGRKLLDMVEDFAANADQDLVVCEGTIRRRSGVETSFQIARARRAIQFLLAEGQCRSDRILLGTRLYGAPTEKRMFQIAIVPHGEDA